MPPSIALDSISTTRDRSPPISCPSKISTVVYPFFRSLQIVEDLNELVEALHSHTAVVRGRSHPTLSSLRRADHRTFYRRWNNFSQSLAGQWQAMNYISAVLVG